MHIAPNRLSYRAARYAWNLLALLRNPEATPKQHRWARLALRYYIARWDFIPDLLPGVGLLDDLLLLGIVASFTQAGDDPLPTHLGLLALEQDIERQLTGRLHLTSIAD